MYTAGVKLGGAALVIVAVLGLAGAAAADGPKVYSVGPGKKVRELADLVGKLRPGDVVEVYGNATYKPVKLTDHGTADARITIRGIRVDGKRPVISGGKWTVAFHYAHFNTFEGFEVTGGEQVCIRHQSREIIVRDTVVHHCARHGILGADDESGSLLLDTVEVHHAGGKPQGENLKHPIYIATDSRKWPGSVFRMQFSYIHDVVGGNAVKSRAERTELYYNWIEGAQYYEAELIGPGGRCQGVREDGDVVGNALVQTSSHESGVYVVRVGGDGTGETCGRYRFVNNLFVARGDTDGPLRCHEGIESIELHNNVFFKLGGKPFTQLVRTKECNWTQGEQIFGTHNWVTKGTPVPATVTQSVFGTGPGFADAEAFDFRLTGKGPLVDAGTKDTAVGGTFAFPSPAGLPEYVPPPRKLLAYGKSVRRQAIGPIDIGPYERGSPSARPVRRGKLSAGGAPSSGSGSNRRSLGCAAASRGGDAAIPLAGIVALVWWRRRRTSS